MLRSPKSETKSAHLPPAHLLDQVDEQIHATPHYAHLANLPYHLEPVPKTESIDPLSMILLILRQVFLRLHRTHSSRLR